MATCNYNELQISAHINQSCRQQRPFQSNVLCHRSTWDSCTVALLPLTNAYLSAHDNTARHTAAPCGNLELYGDRSQLHAGMLICPTFAAGWTFKDYDECTVGDLKHSLGGVHIYKTRAWLRDSHFSFGGSLMEGAPSEIKRSRAVPCRAEVLLESSARSPARPPYKHAPRLSLCTRGSGRTGAPFETGFLRGPFFLGLGRERARQTDRRGKR